MTKTDNQRYIQRGHEMFIRNDLNWSEDLKRENHRKEGAPFQYCQLMIMLIAAVRVSLNIQYRQLDGLVSEMMAGAKTPHYTTIYKRIQKLDVQIDGKKVTVADKDKKILLAVDATGIKQHNCGQWISKKWKIRRGFVKMHVMVDIQTQKIIALAITDESVGDSTMFDELLGSSIDKINAQNALPKQREDRGYDCCDMQDNTKNTLTAGVASITNNKRKCNEPKIYVYGDAGYCSRAIAARLKSLGIASGILHRINCTTKGLGTGDAWGDCIRDQFGGSHKATNTNELDRKEKRENQTYWKSRTKYGSRWTVEFVFSAFKRIFGEHLCAIKWENKVQQLTQGGSVQQMAR